MRALAKAFLLLVVLLGIVAAAGVWYLTRTGLSAREEPGAVETFVARQVRSLAIARRASGLRNPVPHSDAAIADGRAHFADHCAICHANDGSGNTAMGRNMWPKAPDMRLPATQDLTDGELFWIIENGIRFTGMPGWSTGTAEGETASWNLVHFVRRLPNLTSEEIQEMEALNPTSPEEIRQRLAEEEFLRGGKPPAPSQAPHPHDGGHNE